MPAPSMKKVVPILRAKGCSYILDYGAGTFHNSRYLLEKGFRVISVDKPAVIQKYAGICSKSNHEIVSAVADNAFSQWKVRFDAVICTFVLNILDWSTNLLLAKLFSERTQQGGILLVEVKEKTKKTTVNALTLSQVDRLFLNNGFYRLGYSKGRKSIATIYEKM